MIKITKRQRLLITIIFTKIFASAYRSGFCCDRFSLFFKLDLYFYNNFGKELQIIKKQINISENDISERFFLYKILKNTFKKRALFNIIEMYEVFLEIINNDNNKYKKEFSKTKSNDILYKLGKKTELYVKGILDRKLTSKERKYILHVEHIGQNTFVRDKYYSIEELQKILDF